MEDAIKLLVFDFINFISFLKKQPNVPKSWLSRIKRLELKCDNLGLTSKSSAETPPVINVPLPPPSLPETPSRLSSKSSSSQVICDEAYVADWDKDDFGYDGGDLAEDNALDLHTKTNRNPWSLKPEECDRDQLMEQSIKIGKIYVKNFKSLISSTLGKKVEKTALLTNDFRFLLYKANKPKIDTVLDIRGALIQSNKLKSKRFTITCSTDKVDTIEFEASDEEERDSWVYALFKASKGVSTSGMEPSKHAVAEEDTYQRVQESDNYNLIIEDDMDDDDLHLEDDEDEADSHIIYKSPPNGQPVTQADYLLVDDDTDEDFEDDNDFDQEEIDLLPSAPTPVPPESLYEFEDDSSSYSSSSDSSLSLCSPVDTSEFLEPPSLPAKNQPPLKAPTDIPPRSKCLSKHGEESSISESPPELPPKKGNIQRKPSSKKSSRKSTDRPLSKKEDTKQRHSAKSVEAPFPPPPRQSPEKRASLQSSPQQITSEQNEERQVKSKSKLSMKKRFLRTSSSSKSYDVNPPEPVTPSSSPPVSMDMIKNELKQKVELRNKRMQMKQGGENSLDDIRSNASSEAKDLDFLGKKPSEVKVSNQGVKPQVLKPKPLLKQNQKVGKVPSSKGTLVPDSPRTEYKKRMEKVKDEEMQKQMEALRISEGSSMENSDKEEDDDW